jgi:hypothetical protein
MSLDAFLYVQEPITLKDLRAAGREMAQALKIDVYAFPDDADLSQRNVMRDGHWSVAD